jgi:hypothetical protein
MRQPTSSELSHLPIGSIRFAEILRRAGASAEEVKPHHSSIAMLNGVNDTPEDARRLARLLSGN